MGEDDGLEAPTSLHVEKADAGLAEVQEGGGVGEAAAIELQHPQHGAIRIRQLPNQPGQAVEIL